MTGQHADIAAIRARLLTIMLYGVAALGLPVVVTNVVAMARLGFWFYLVFLVTIWLQLVICAMARERLPFILRAVVLLGTLYAAGIWALGRYGLVGGGPVLMLSISVLATVLFGLRAGLVVGVMAMFTMSLAGLLFVLDLVERDPRIETGLDSHGAWLSVTPVYGMLTVSLVLATGLLQRRLLGSLADLGESARLLAREVSQRAELQAEKKELTDQLIQAQKLEALGQLAGGIAHDFNNVLTIIRGNAELAMALSHEGSLVSRRLERVLNSADRASELTGRLLAFSRRKVLEMAPLSVHGCMCELEPMLRQLIGEDVELVLRLEARFDGVLGDRNQLDLVVMNLALNARDAMPEGGRLVLRSEDGGDGGRLRLHVEDTGVGMDEATCQRVFEPFFTTKEQSRGTGLGLTMVYNIVQQHKGSIHLRSRPGHGTSFTVELPTTAARPPAVEATAAREPVPRGDETVLLVEDEADVRETTRIMLEELGYHVYEAATPEQAMVLAEELRGQLDLLLTDVVMPGINGRQLAERLLEKQPDLAVVFASGYTDDDVLRRGVASEKVHFLAKPFTPARLALRLREALEADDDPPDVTEEITMPRGRL